MVRYPGKPPRIPPQRVNLRPILADLNKTRFAAVPPPIPADALRNNAIPPPIPSDIRFKIATPVNLGELDPLHLATTLRASQLKEAVGILAAEKGDEVFTRYRTKDAMLGALIHHNGERDVAVIGDLHGNFERLKLIIETYKEKLIAGEMDLVFLGDIIHPETRGGAGNMISSLLCLNAIVNLKRKMKNNIHLLIGNHDLIYTALKFMDDTIENVFGSKNINFAKFIEEKGYSDQDLLSGMGILKKGRAQSFLFLYELCNALKERGYEADEVRSLVSNYQAFFDYSALAMIVKTTEGDILLAHSGVVEGGISIDDLIDIRADKKLTQNYVWNKPSTKTKQGDRNPLFTYYEADVDATCEKLGVVRIVNGHITNPNDVTWTYKPYGNDKVTAIHSNISGVFGHALLSQNGIEFIEEYFLMPQAEARI